MSDALVQAYRLDAAAVTRAFNRAAEGYDAVSVLQDRVREELIGRLDLVQLQPQLVVDVGAGTGRGALALAQRYRRARVLAIDTAPAMLAQAARRRGWRGRFALARAQAQALPLADDSAQLLFCHLTLQWCDDLDAALSQFARVLAPNGLLSFATYGPDTLRELRSAWAAADSHPHVNAFIDMHDIGDALVRAGFEEPVLDVERFTLTYPSPTALMRELRALGAVNAMTGRLRGLTGRGTWELMLAHYDQYREDGRVPATFEVVYGHAWASHGIRHTTSGGETRVAVDSIRRRAHP